MITFSLLLSGCSSDKEPEQKAKSEDVKKATKILEPQMKTLNKAKDMEKFLQDAEATRKKKMDEQEEPT